MHIKIRQEDELFEAEIDVLLQNSSKNLISLDFEQIFKTMKQLCLDFVQRQFSCYGLFFLSGGESLLNFFSCRPWSYTPRRIDFFKLSLHMFKATESGKNASLSTVSYKCVQACQQHFKGTTYDCFSEIPEKSGLWPFM